jgi:hypothetical protein
MYSFDIVIENKERRMKQGKALHFMAAALLLTLGTVGLMNLPKSAIFLYLGFPAGILVMLLMIFKSKWLIEIKYIRFLRLVEAATLSAAAVLLLLQHQWFTGILFALTGILLVITLLVEIQLHTGVRVMVDDKGVTRLVGGQTRLISWRDIENVLVNSDILTVDMTNNYIMQSKFSNDMDATEREQFNDYCKVQLLVH